MEIKDKWERYLTYIELAGGAPTIEEFDEDWEPIGLTIRVEMKELGLIEEVDGTVRRKQK